MVSLRRIRQCLCIAAVVWLSVGVMADEGPRNTDPHSARLIAAGIEPTVEGIGAYFGALHPDDEARREYKFLIRQLGSDDYFDRKRAMEQLLRSPIVDAELLAGATQAKDPEIRWRARHIAKVAEDRVSELLYSVFAVIHERKLTGLAEPVLSTLSFCTTDYLQTVSRKALVATVRPEDAEELREALSSERAHARVAAAEAMTVLLGAEAADDLRPLFDDDDDVVRLAAARSLAGRGVREALPVLARLLDSDSVQVRSRSVQSLRSLTGQRFQYAAYAKPEDRAAAAEKWRQWVAERGDTAELELNRETEWLGRTLICDRGRNLLIELDAEGKEIWQQAVMRPYACQGLPNGHRLVASYTAGKVIEYDARGKAIWEQAGLTGVYSVQRLETGNTLCACYTGRKVVEVSPANKVVWEVDLPDRPRDARRLENGNTLVSLYSSNRVAEVDPSGDIVWELGDMGFPYAAERLPNGNTLVAQYRNNRVVEVDHDGKVIWTHTTRGRVYDAQRLPNGNTIVVESTGAYEYTPDGKLVWEWKQASLRRVHRF